MRTFRILTFISLLLSGYLAFGQASSGLSSPSSIELVANAGSTGTTVNTLTKLTGAPSTAVIAATTDTSGVVGVTIAGAGTSGSATLQLNGIVSLVFDGATTAGDYVQISSTTAGNGHDAGSGCPTSGQVVGRVLTTNGSAGTYTVNLGGNGCGSGSSSASNALDKTSSFTASTSSIYLVTCSGACTATLPSSITTGYSISLWNLGAGTITISSGGPTYTGTTSLLQGQAISVTTDGTIYQGSPLLSFGTGILVSRSGTGVSLSINVNAQLTSTFDGVLANSQVIYYAPSTIALTVPSSCTGSYMNALTAATGSSAFSIVDVTTSTTLCTATFAASGTTATFSGSGGSVSAGDVIKVTGPSTADATLATVGMGIHATHS